MLQLLKEKTNFVFIILKKYSRISTNTGGFTSCDISWQMTNNNLFPIAFLCCTSRPGSIFRDCRDRTWLESWGIKVPKMVGKYKSRPLGSVWELPIWLSYDFNLTGWTTDMRWQAHFPNPPDCGGIKACSHFISSFGLGQGQKFPRPVWF